MIYIINIIVSLLCTWFTYFVYRAKTMNYDSIADQILDFTRRFLFQSAFLVILPLLYTDAIEMQHQQQNLNKGTDLQSQKSEFTYSILFIIPIVLILNELYEIYQRVNPVNEIIKTNHTQQSALPPPPILQPKVISEYVYENQEEVNQLESYYQKQKQYSLVDESKKSRGVNFMDKIQMDAVIQSDYGKSGFNKSLSIARHAGIKPTRTQTIRETQPDIPEPKIAIGELSFLNLLFGYVIGVQEKYTISIPLVMLCSLLTLNQFRDLLLFSNAYLNLVTRPGMITYLFLLYLLQIMAMLVGMYYNCLLMQVSYCIIVSYCIKPYFRLFATQSIRTTLIQSGISLIVILIIKVVYYLCS